MSNLPTRETIFEKILKGEVECSKVYEDQQVLAFNDINPQAPTHIVLIPKSKLTRLMASEETHKELLGHMTWAAGEIARQKQLHKGWRLVVNDGEEAGQAVPYLHFHILSGRQLLWPPG